MKDWQPIVKDAHEMELELVEDFGFGTKIKTYAHISEGDTLFIRQEGFEKGKQHVALGKEEFYNLIFNFMSNKELKMIMNARHKQAFNSIK